MTGFANLQRVSQLSGLSKKRPGEVTVRTSSNQRTVRASALRYIQRRGSTETTENEPQERWFGHSGDMGDIIYALPTIRAAGGGILYLYAKPGTASVGMNENRAASLRSLIIQQRYIEDVIFCPNGRPPHAADHKLNEFRHHFAPGRNLADVHLATHGFGPEHRNEEWIRVGHRIKAKEVVFARSTRYRNDSFPWRRIWEECGAVAGFVGTSEEHQDFCEQIGSVARIETANLLEVARVIAGSALFIGNQSCPAAISEGLKHPMILEVFPPFANCCFERPHRLNGWDENIALRDVARATWI